MPEIVTVFGASGRIGQAQIVALLRAGYSPRAVTRNPSILSAPKFLGCEIIAADYDDRASLDRALAGAGAVFLQPPSMSDVGDVWRQCSTLRDAAVNSGIHRFVLNSTMWAPDDAPCGEAFYDHVRRIENLFAATDLPLVIFRPVLFMDNLLTRFARGPLVEEGVYRYCHRPGLMGSWISMDDVAQFMIAGLERNDLIGQRIAIGGPETLAVEDMLAYLSQAIGRPLSHEFVPPRQFGEYLYDTMLGGAPGPARDGYAAFFESFYNFNNYAPQRPFEVDMAPVLARIPFRLERFNTWAARQDWTPDGTGSAVIGSVSG